MSKSKHKQLISYLSLFLLINSALSFYEKPIYQKSESNLYQIDENNDFSPTKNEVVDILKSLALDNTTIEINKEGKANYTLNPKTNYTFILNNTLNHFFKSKYDNIIYDSNLKSLPKFSGFGNINKPVYVNNSYDELIQLEVVSLKMKSNIVCLKVPSPRIAGIRSMTGSELHIFQPLNDNYFYQESYDKTSSFYYAEYNDDITVDDIININNNFFKEGVGKLIHMEKNKIYIGIFLQNFAFTKLYFHDSLPKIIDLNDGNKEALYLESNQKYLLNFTKNTLPFIIRLNPKINSSLKINDSEINSTNKYFYPYKHDEVIEASVGNEGVLIEILFTMDENKIDVINNTNNCEFINTKKNITLIEYIPSNDNKKNLEIYLQSKDNINIGVYGGLSKDNYFYFSNNIINNNYNVKYYFIKLNNPLKDIQLESNEKYYITLIFNKINPEQEIKISLTNYENIIETLYEPIEQTYMNNIISNLTNILQNYIFLDIMKNPPEPEGYKDYVHSPFNLIEALNNINRTNRKFYDFYQEIRKYLGASRNLQLRIYGFSTTKKIKLSHMTACLPFSIYVDKDTKDNNKTKIFIKYFNDCAHFFDENIRTYIKNKSDKKIALEKINDLDPFKFLQDWGRIYQGLKSPHGHFTLMKTIFHAFYIRLLPYSPEELKMKFKFEDDNDILKLDYYIYIPDTSQMFLEDDFEDFFESQISHYKNKIMEPNIFYFLNKYKKQKGLLTEEKNEIKIIKEIDWDIKSEEDNGIKCKVDKDKQINVLLQESFDLNKDKNLEIIYQCSKKFHENNFRIVVIENLNPGGYEELSLSLRQLLQVKIKNKSYFAFKPIELIRNNYNSYYSSETCNLFKSEDDFLNGKDIYYSTLTEKIIHKKTKIFDLVTKEGRIFLEDKRKELLKLNIKKPTDIIIFTDAYSYGAGSIFLKAVQNEGAAITVGFNGNPYLSSDLFDSSQSPGLVMDFAQTKEYSNLKSLGFIIRGLAIGESYEDDYLKEKAVSREYKLNSVDEKVDIYESYTDDKYDIFIEKAKEIFKKYNEEGKCNPNNTRLVFDNDTQCLQFNDDKYAHGGYKCGSDGKWSSLCQKYYCDLGYYYNIYKGKCMRDYCTNESKEINIILNDTYEKIIILNSENNDEYIFIINNNNFAYSFKTNQVGFIYFDNNTLCPSNFIVKKDEPNHNNKIYVNYYKNITDQEINIIITSSKISDAESKNDNKGLKAWAIAFIIIGSLLIVGIIILIIHKLRRANEKIDSEKIGKLVGSDIDDMKEME